MKTPFLMIFVSLLFLTLFSCDKEKPKSIASASRELNVEESLNRRIRQLERQLQASEEMIARQSTRIEELVAETKASLAREGEAIRISGEMIEHTKTLANQQQRQLSQPATPTGNPAYTSSIPTAPVTQRQWWTPPSPNTAAKDIKARAIAEWKDNYRMIDYEIREQTEAFEALKKLNLTYSKETKDIIAKAVEKWPGSNYRMALHETNEQLDALRNLQSR